MSIKELEQTTRLPKTFTLDLLVAGALRTAAFQEDRTMSDIVDTALSEWLVRFGYMTVNGNDELNEIGDGDTND